MFSKIKQRIQNLNQLKTPGPYRLIVYNWFNNIDLVLHCANATIINIKHMCTLKFDDITWWLLFDKFLIRSKVAISETGQKFGFLSWWCNEDGFLDEATFKCSIHFLKVVFFQKVLAKFSNFSKCHSWEPKLFLNS